MSLNDNNIKIINIKQNGGDPNDKDDASSVSNISFSDDFSGDGTSDSESTTSNESVSNSESSDDKSSVSSSDDSETSSDDGSDDSETSSEYSGSGDSSDSESGMSGGSSDTIDKLSADPLFLVLSHFLSSGDKNIVDALFGIKSSLDNLNHNITAMNEKLDKVSLSKSKEKKHKNKTRF